MLAQPRPTHRALLRAGIATQGRVACDHSRCRTDSDRPVQYLRLRPNGSRPIHARVRFLARLEAVAARPEARTAPKREIASRFPSKGTPQSPEVARRPSSAIPWNDDE